MYVCGLPRTIGRWNIHSCLNGIDTRLKGLWERRLNQSSIGIIFRRNDLHHLRDHERCLWPCKLDTVHHIAKAVLALLALSRQRSYEDWRNEFAPITWLYNASLTPKFLESLCWLLCRNGQYNKTSSIAVKLNQNYMIHHHARLLKPRIKIPIELGAEDFFFREQWCDCNVSSMMSITRLKWVLICFFQCWESFVFVWPCQSNVESDPTKRHSFYGGVSLRSKRLLACLFVAFSNDSLVANGNRKLLQSFND